jgi:hypothetical protein
VVARVTCCLEDHSFLFALQRSGGDFGTRLGDFFAAQQRDDIVPNLNDDTSGGLDCVGAAGGA